MNIPIFCQSNDCDRPCAYGYMYCEECNNMLKHIKGIKRRITINKKKIQKRREEEIKKKQALWKMKVEIKRDSEKKLKMMNLPDDILTSFLKYVELNANDYCYRVVGNIIDQDMSQVESVLTNIYNPEGIKDDFAMFYVPLPKLHQLQYVCLSSDEINNIMCRLHDPDDDIDDDDTDDE